MVNKTQAALSIGAAEIILGGLMANKEWCRHYAGLERGKTCEAGVEMDTVITKAPQKPGIVWACCYEEARHLCPAFEHYTAEEIATSEAEIIAFLERFTALNSGQTNICHHCGKEIESMRQVGRCVYGSCGCRLWQGKVPATWKDRS